MFQNIKEWFEVARFLFGLIIATLMIIIYLVKSHLHRKWRILKLYIRKCKLFKYQSWTDRF